MFGWLTRKVYEAMSEGARRFMADIHPENPPATVEEMKALIAAPAPALPAAEDETEQPAKPRAKK